LRGGEVRRRWFGCTRRRERRVRALEPHGSGAFPEGETGSGENAGMGLFFISEMAKATDGRMLLAARGATYFLDRSRDHDAQPIRTNGGIVVGMVRERAGFGPQ